MKRIIYLVAIVSTFVSASAKQVRFSSNLQIRSFPEGSTLFFARHGKGQRSGITLFSDTNAVSGPVRPKGDIGFSTFYSCGRQGHYDSRYGNVSYVDHLTLFGSDWGGILNYRRILGSNLMVTLGIGYLDFEVDRIENETKSGGLTMKTHARPINYPSNILVLYQTTRYHYDNLCFHLGLTRQLIFFDRLPLFAGVDYLHAYRIYGVYYIPFAHRHYRTKNRGNFGDFISARFGMDKRWGRFSLAPAFVLSIYKGWRQDVNLGENPSRVVSNWFNGAGISMALSYRIFH
jgi:hypothetical protein